MARNGPGASIQIRKGNAKKLATNVIAAANRQRRKATNAATTKIATAASHMVRIGPVTCPPLNSDVSTMRVALIVKNAANTRRLQ